MWVFTLIGLVFSGGAAVWLLFELGEKAINRVVEIAGFKREFLRWYWNELHRRDGKTPPGGRN